MQQAIDAMREYHQAQDNGAPPEEVERLRIETVLGGPAATRH